MHFLSKRPFTVHLSFTFCFVVVHSSERLYCLIDCFLLLVAIVPYRLFPSVGWLFPSVGSFGFAIGSLVLDCFLLLVLLALQLSKGSYISSASAFAFAFLCICHRRRNANANADDSKNLNSSALASAFLLIFSSENVLNNIFECF